MAKVEAYFEFGKLLGVFQKMNPPQFVTLLRDSTGSLMPLYEGHNDVPPGEYSIFVYQPYKSDGNKLEQAGHLSSIEIDSRTLVDHIVFGYLEGQITSIRRCQGMNESEWNNYVQSRGTRLQRYIGWRAETAIRMLND